VTNTDVPFNTAGKLLEDALRVFTQQDLLASTIRVSLGLVGPVGPIIAEFLTQFVPGQRIDRLHNWVEQLNDRLCDVEAGFQERLASSPTYAALAEAAEVAAVESPSDERRTERPCHSVTNGTLADRC
jgi:hypothetical protein